MPNVCSVCRHDRRPEIDDAITRGLTLRDIERTFGPSRSALARHKRCIRGALAQHGAAVAAQTASTFQSTEMRLEVLFKRAESVLQGCIDQKDQVGQLASIKVALGVIAEIRELAKLKGVQSTQYTPRTESIDDELLRLLGPDGPVEGRRRAEREQRYQEIRQEVLAELAQAGRLTVQ